MTDTPSKKRSWVFIVTLIGGTIVGVAHIAFDIMLIISLVKLIK